jgi:hypothetical protein
MEIFFEKSIDLYDHSIGNNPIRTSKSKFHSKIILARRIPLLLFLRG